MGPPPCHLSTRWHDGTFLPCTHVFCIPPAPLHAWAVWAGLFVLWLQLWCLWCHWTLLWWYWGRSSCRVWGCFWSLVRTLDPQDAQRPAHEPALVLTEAQGPRFPILTLVALVCVSARACCAWCSGSGLYGRVLPVPLPRWACLPCLGSGVAVCGSNIRRV